MFHRTARFVLSIRVIYFAYLNSVFSPLVKPGSGFSKSDEPGQADPAQTPLPPWTGGSVHFQRQAEEERACGVMEMSSEGRWNGIRFLEESRKGGSVGGEGPKQGSDSQTCTGPRPSSGGHPLFEEP